MAVTRDGWEEGEKLTRSYSNREFWQWKKQWSEAQHSLASSKSDHLRVVVEIKHWSCDSEMMPPPGPASWVCVLTIPRLSTKMLSTKMLWITWYLQPLPSHREVNCCTGFQSIDNPLQLLHPGMCLLWNRSKHPQPRLTKSHEFYMSFPPQGSEVKGLEVLSPTTGNGIQVSISCQADLRVPSPDPPNYIISIASYSTQGGELLNEIWNHWDQQD
jgi:hypothetical protein